MQNTFLPAWCRIEHLTLINYYRYSSHVTDSVICVNETERNSYEKYPSQLHFFHKLRETVMACDVDSSERQDGINLQKRVWDTQVVIECRTRVNNKIFIGNSDGKWCIGFGVRSDPSYIKPYKIYQTKEK